MKQIILFNKKYVEDIDFGNGFKITSDTLDNISNIDKTINEMFNYAGIKQSGDFLKDINNGQLLRDYKWTILNYDETKCDECLNDIMDFETSGFDSFEKTKMEKVLNNCLKLNFAKNSKYLQSLKRFNTACKRTDMGDQILDIAACLESLFNINNELRLRLALSAYYLTKDKEVMLDIYELYEMRSKYVHSNTLPIIEKSDLKKKMKSAFRILEIPLLTGKFYDLNDINLHILDFET